MIIGIEFNGHTFEDEQGSGWIVLDGPAGRLHDEQAIAELRRDYEIDQAEKRKAKHLREVMDSDEISDAISTLHEYYKGSVMAKAADVRSDRIGKVDEVRS